MFSHFVYTSVYVLPCNLIHILTLSSYPMPCKYLHGNGPRYSNKRHICAQPITMHYSVVKMTVRNQ